MTENETRKVGYVYTNRLPGTLQIAAYHSLASQTMDSAFEILDGHRYIAVDDDLSGNFHTPAPPSQLIAPVADADRWIEATRALVERVKEITWRKNDALRRLNPKTAGIRRQILWTIRHAGGRSQMRAEYQATCERLYGEMAAAYQAYDEQASDLADHVHAESERLKLVAQRRLEERQRRELREREKRAAALGGPEDTVWACHVAESPRGERHFRIWLPALDRDPIDRRGEPMLTQATAREIQAAIARERAEHPSTPVSWGSNTLRAMRERQPGDYGDEVATWQELTGERIERSPRRPGEDRGRSNAYGPSSTYGSDHGGGDYGGGGYSGGSY